VTYQLLFFPVISVTKSKLEYARAKKVHFAMTIPHAIVAMAGINGTEIEREIGEACPITYLVSLGPGVKHLDENRL